MRAKREIIGALDLGSSEVKIIIAELVGNDLTVLGCGRAPCEGIVSGRVASISDTAEAIIPALADAEQMSGCELSEVLVCFSGRHIDSFNNRGSVYHKKVCPASHWDVTTAIENATHVKIPEGAMIMNVVPRHYILDENQGIRDPLRMSCMKLEADVHLTLAATVIMDNIQRAVEKAGLKVRDFVVSPLASSLAVLEEEEKDMGVLLINLGAGTTGLQAWRDGHLDWTAVVDVGGNRVTTAINRSLRTPVNMAEKTKIEFGAATADSITSDECLSVETVGGRAPCRISRLALIEDIIQPTVEEWFSAVFEFVSRSVDMKTLSAGIVVTGGASRMAGTIDMADAVFGIPARLGAPRNVKGLQSIVEGDPSMASAWGTVLYRAAAVGFEGGLMPMAPRSTQATVTRGVFGGLINKAMGLV